MYIHTVSPYSRVCGIVCGIVYSFCGHRYDGDLVVNDTILKVCEPKNFQGYLLYINISYSSRCILYQTTWYVIVALHN